VEIGKNNRSLSFSWVCLILAGSGLMAHGLLVFTDYILWDGYWYYAQLAAPDGPHGMMRLFSEIGRPLDSLFVLPFGLFTGPVPAKVAGLVAWILISIPMFYVLHNGAGMPQDFALIVSIVAVVLPVFDVLGEIALWMNTFALLIFWFGFALLVASSRMHGICSMLGKSAALFTLVISFNLNSLLVFYYALGLFLFSTHFFLVDDCGRLNFAIATRLKKYWLFVFAPIGYWLAKLFLVPAHGYYLEYNKPVFSSQRMLSGVISLAQFLIAEAFDVASSWWTIGLALFVVTLVATGLKLNCVNRQISAQKEELDFKTGLASIGGGFILLLAAAFPYAVVDQSLSSFGWLSRNCILTPLPIALLICGLSFAICKILAANRPRSWLLPIVAIIVISITTSNRNYLRFQALGAKQESIGIKINEAISSSDAVVVQLRDYFMIPNTIYYYPPIIWSYIAALSAPYPSTFVFETTQIVPNQEFINDRGDKQISFPAVRVNSQVLQGMLDQTTMPYILRSVPLQGPQIMFIVQQGKYGNDGVNIGARYLWLKWLMPDRLSEFLDGLTATMVLELSPIGPA